MDMPMLAGETVVDDEIDSEEHSRFLPTDKESDLPVIFTIIMFHLIDKIFFLLQATGCNRMDANYLFC